MLATNPSIGMEINTKTITVPTENVEMYIGNASINYHYDIECIIVCCVYYH